MLHFVYRNVGESVIEYCNSSTYYLCMYNINGSASSAGLTMVQVVDGSPRKYIGGFAAYIFSGSPEPGL